MEENKGISFCLKNGIELCSNEYIVKMDSDDIMFPDRIMVQLNFMKANPNCVMCGSNIQFFTTPENSNVKQLQQITKHQYLMTWEMYKQTKPHWFMNHPSLLYKKCSSEFFKEQKSNPRETIKPNPQINLPSNEPNTTDFEIKSVPKPPDLPQPNLLKLNNPYELSNPYKINKLPDSNTIKSLLELEKKIQFRGSDIENKYLPIKQTPNYNLQIPVSKNNKYSLPGINSGKLSEKIIPDTIGKQLP